jgi:chemotaxis protein CheZ
MGPVQMNEVMKEDPRLSQARELVRHLEAGETEQADALIAQMTNLHESALFRDLGRLTRELHEAINGFLLDDRLQALADHEMRDAAERLRYVISMTEQSANKTLSAIEQSMPLVERLREEAGRLSGEWQKFRDRQLSVAGFRVLSRELAEFLSAVGKDSGELHGRLSEVLMAQDFQDLTGQIIRKVINLVQDVEDKLVQLIRLAGESAGKPEPSDAAQPKGPAVPGVDKDDVVQGQDEVDDLLSSLGF